MIGPALLLLAAAVLPLLAFRAGRRVGYRCGQADSWATYRRALSGELYRRMEVRERRRSRCAP